MSQDLEMDRVALRDLWRVPTGHADMYQKTLGHGRRLHRRATQAQLQERWDEADSLYCKSVVASDMLSDEMRNARNFNQLIALDLRRKQSWETEGRCRQALLTIGNELRDQVSVARSYHRLGSLARQWRRWTEAEDWYRESMKISKKLKDEERLAITCYALGMISQYRERWGEAEDWYRQSLAIHRRLGCRCGMVWDYHGFGRIAQGQRRWEEAEIWYLKSIAESENWCCQLDIEKEIPDRRQAMASNFGQLGLLALEQDRTMKALEWMIRSVTVFDKFPHPATYPAPAYLRRLTARLGVAALQECWKSTTDTSVPPDVWEFLQIDSA